jgi:hypothetical protein
MNPDTTPAAQLGNSSVPMYYAPRWYGELIPNLHIGHIPVTLSWSAEQNRVKIVTTKGVVLYDMLAQEIEGSELTLNELKLKIGGKWRIFYYRSATENTDRIGLTLLGRVANITSGIAGTVEMKNAHIDELQSMIQQGGHKADSIELLRAISFGIVSFFLLVIAIIAFAILT